MGRGSLTVEKLDVPAPSFRFKEFSSLAEVVRSSLSSVGRALKNEREFLQFASHELRSPLTAMRSNVELLKLNHADQSVANNEGLQRIERATRTMTQLVQTLLWLSREEHESDIEDQPFSLEDLTHEVVEELDYLRAGKPLEVNLKTTPQDLVAGEKCCSHHCIQLGTKRLSTYRIGDRLNRADWRASSHLQPLRSAI